MIVRYLLFFIILPVFAQNLKHIEPIPVPKNPEDFEHQFKGCLANSECDQVMGLQLGRWKEITDKLKASDATEEQKARELEEFRSKYGIPVEFYTYQKSQQSFRPMLFDSPCKNHNPKDKNLKVLKGTSFLKSLKKESATIWRDQAQIEVPTGELLIPQPVTVHFPDKAITFYLPLNDQPLFIKDKELYILREDNELFYALKVNQNGDWKIVPLNFGQLSDFEEKKQHIQCPSHPSTTPKVFTSTFCKSVWDESQKKTVVVEMHQGCII